MSNLRKSDLQASQLHDLELFMTRMTNRGWQPSGTFSALFDQGWAVPYQAEFRVKKGSASTTARYVCGRSDMDNLINFTLHTAQDNQMIALPFGRIQTHELDHVLGFLEQLPQEGVRTVLEQLAGTGINVKVNVYDEYLPLNKAALDRIYGTR